MERHPECPGRVTASNGGRATLREPSSNIPPSANPSRVRGGIRASLPEMSNMFSVNRCGEDLGEEISWIQLPGTPEDSDVLGRNVVANPEVSYVDVSVSGGHVLAVRGELHAHVVYINGKLTRGPFRHETWLGSFPLNHGFHLTSKFA